jgi:serine protease Do
MNTAIISNGRSEGNIGIGFAVPINTVRDLLPQLFTGRVIRGRIGVEVRAVPRDGFEDFGLKSRRGAIVARVSPGGAAEKGGLEPGDVILEYNGRPIASTTDLVKMVTATKPGTSVPLKILRDKKDKSLNVSVEELDLQAEQGAGSSSRNDAPPTPEQQGSDSFGLTLSNLTPQRARQLEVPSGQTGAVVTEVDPNGPSAGALLQGDVILSVNRQRVSSAAEAGRELSRIASGRLAQILVWRQGQGQVFVPVRKE